MANAYKAGDADDRPWGRWEVLAVGEGYVVKQITVNPGEILSLQRHRHRAEHWIVTKGRARVTIDDRMVELERDGRAFIPAGAAHRIANPGDTVLEFIEVQTGDTLDEADIERLEDRYGRTG